jgi:hypothetical protein
MLALRAVAGFADQSERTHRRFRLRPVDVKTWRFRMQGCGTDRNGRLRPRMPKPVGTRARALWSGLFFCAISTVLAVAVAVPAGARTSATARRAGGSFDGFHQPESVAVDSSGNVFVADTGANRTVKFDPSGALINSWGGRGTGTGKFASPVGLAVDASDRVFVADARNDRIQEFDDSGNFIREWGSAGSASG